MHLKIAGTITPGLGRASTIQLPVQLPQLIDKFPELRNVYMGTINVRLDEPLIILKPPDLRSGVIVWRGPDRYIPENFDFVRARFECPVGTETIPAWIYLPQWTPHRSNLYFIEVLTQYVPDAKTDVRCMIGFDRDFERQEVLMI
jgi:CTP-dependent riboflavin kinase